MDAQDLGAKIYICPNCGGEVRFDIKRRLFLCTSCQSVISVTTDKPSVDEYRFEDYDIHQKNGVQVSGASVQCQNCGGEIYFGSSDTASRCPMCGSSQIRLAAVKSGIYPEGIIPFRIDRQEAQQRFRFWISRRLFAPNALKHSHSEGALQGLYVPYWTYDAKARGEYSGQGGRVRTVRDRDGDSHTVVDWYPVSGTVYGAYDDIAVCASRQQSGTMAARVGPFDTRSDLLPFAPQYLAGYMAQRYSIDGKTAFTEARATMESDLRSKAHSDIMSHGFQQARVSFLRPAYKDITYKSVLLPVYCANYSYGGNEYFYAVNGETGNVAGLYPKSAVKIALAVIAVLVVFVALMLFFGVGAFEL